ncbi:IS30 family transposase [Spiroplasma endosymbiont of Phyllotreta cruciferae]|uniref:IS30 family transposase n=1 Tax=Spiroplasma endosymbiont of Phyllotreta cruciferae TaxID=2886375 RepID=UPI00209C72DF|nr:IS30 family transposase [Spiroplasma endosymbiont of Phyllotreta cruciferae]
MYSHLSFIDKVKLEKLILSKLFLKKNGEINIAQIAKCLNRHRSTILREIKRFKTINEYSAYKSAYKSDKMYYEKRKKNNKRYKFTKEQLNFIKIRFNKYHDTPEQLIYRYFLEFGVKFPACVKTLYKWIRLGEFGLKKENLPHRGKKYKTKGKPDNRGKLINFKSIWDIENKETDVVWFEMDTVVGKDHQSSNLVLVEQNSKSYFVMKLKNHTANEVVEKFKDIVINNNLFGKIKGIITDRGKEFSKWRELEIFAETQVYFCDPCKPQQKPLIEYMNYELREWYPKGTDFNNVSQQKIDWVVNVINEKLRPVLNWRTSKEVFLENFR